MTKYLTIRLELPDEEAANIHNRLQYFKQLYMGSPTASMSISFLPEWVQSVEVQDEVQLHTALVPPAAAEHFRKAVLGLWDKSHPLCGRIHSNEEDCPE